MPCQLSAFFSLPLEKYFAVEHLSFPYENEAASPSETASQIWRISSCPAPSRAHAGQSNPYSELCAGTGQSEAANRIAWSVVSGHIQSRLI